MNDELDQKIEAKTKVEAKTEVKAEVKSASAPSKGPTFYRNPKGGPLVTTKPDEADDQ